MRPKIIIYLFLPLIVIIVAILMQFKINNTCRTYLGYFNILFSSDCYYHPDQDDDMLEIIRRHVGVSEIHEVQTEDGYILGLFRIPRKNPKGVILLQHALYVDSSQWVAQFNESVAFIFWRAGYDVWMSNSRGTLASKKHITLKSTERAFWDFSFHELGFYDHHATIGYITNKTKSKIIYLGHSMGSSTGLVYASTRPEEAARSIKLMITMVPVSHFSRGTSMARFISPTFFYLYKLFNFDLRSTMLKEDTYYLKLSKFLRLIFPCKKCITYLLCLLSGWTPDETDPHLINMAIKIQGSESPLKISEHFNQIYVSGGKFRMYDYGTEENLRFYGEEEPPFYPLHKINVPVYIIYGQNDTFATINDIEALYADLPEKSKIYGKLMVEGFGHGDFLIGRHRNERVFTKILELLEKI